MRALELVRLGRSIAPHEALLGGALVALTDRYFWLMDDAFIYFRYADNALFLDRGLVYNAGEHVEAYSSPLWMLLLLGLRGLELDYWTLVRAAAAVFALAFWALSVAINRAALPEQHARPINVPIALACAHYGVASHFSSGLESPLVQLAAAVFALAALRPTSTTLLALLGFAPLVRPELLLACAAFGAFFLVTQRRVPWALLASGLVVNGGWLVFRVYYYADLLPNTYYAKGVSDWSQGLAYVANAFGPVHAAMLVALLALALAPRQRARLEATAPARLAMLACALPVALWVMRIGGDMLYFRYAAFPFCLALFATAGVAEAAVLGVPRVRAQALAPVIAGLAALASYAGYPPQLSEHPLGEPESRKVHDIGDPHWHRRHGGLAYTAKNRAFDRAQRDAYRSPRASAATKAAPLVHPWCRRGFAEPERHVMNVYGLTDPVLARLDVRPFRPGHKDLRRPAKQLAKLYQRFGYPARPGAFRRAVEARKAPRWIRTQLRALELIEAKARNRHELWPNLALALQRTGRLRP